MSDPTLARFKEAQAHGTAGFATAVAELRAGRKIGHWIWYVFPQLAGLGHSAAAETYGIRGLGEASRYLRDPLLRSRLFDITSVVLEQLRRGTPLDALMGSRIDALKVVSSLTLFEHVARAGGPEGQGAGGPGGQGVGGPGSQGAGGAGGGRVGAPERDDGYSRLARVVGEVLDLAEAQRYPRCEYTLRYLAATDRHG